MKRLFSIIFFVSLISAQDLSYYFNLMEQGKYEEVRSNLPTLREKYPNNPAVMFLDAISMERAEDAIVVYKMLIQRHPNSDYADDAVMKIGEYYYARGLYTQACRQLLKVPKSYPRSEHVQRAIDLQINALLASGEKDSARFYVQVYKKRFPTMDFNYNFEPEKPVIARSLEESVVPVKSQEEKAPLASATVTKTPIAKKKEIETELPRSEPVEEKHPKPFVIQVGAYGSVNNALRQKQLLEQMGYEVELPKISSRGKTLHAVQVVRFATRDEAEKVGKKLKTDLGYNFFVLKRPK